MRKRNITLSVDEDVLHKVREAAQKRGTTVNEMVREYLVGQAQEESDESFARLFKKADELKLNLNGWKWNREEVYDRKSPF